MVFKSNQLAINDGCPKCGCEDADVLKSQRIERTNEPVTIHELNSCNFCGNQYRSKREEISAEIADNTEIGLP
jgi:predicted  nucleic acid-binding Zn-ribbon protein